MKWRRVKLGEILESSKECRFVEHPLDEKLISVQLHGKGAVQRVLSQEKTPSPFKGFVGREGQIVYSRIWARKGAIAKIGKDLDGVVVSSEFPLFNVCPVADIDYLIYAFQSSSFKQQLELAGAGTSGQNRIKEKAFLNFEIPLPPLGEQKRIAEILGGVFKAISEVRTEIKRVESLCGAVVSLYAEDQSTKKLEDLATLSGGLSLGSHRKNKPHSVGYLRVANVFWGKILYDEIKELNCTDQEFERTLLQDGDVLITEAHANRFQVGRSAVFRGEEQALVFQNHLFRARPNKNIDSDVLAAMLSSVAVRRQLYQMAKTTSGLNTISISQVRSLRVPVLDTTKQAELLSFLQESNKLNHLLHRKLSLLQELQKSLATRAFAGLL